VRAIVERVDVIFLLLMINLLLLLLTLLLLYCCSCVTSVIGGGFTDLLDMIQTLCGREFSSDESIIAINTRTRMKINK
jgi:uncharacterized protein involved in cysteine biosynthesis